MFEKDGLNTLEKIEKMFAKMSDAEVLDCICKNKPLYVATKYARLEISMTSAKSLKPTRNA